MNRTSNLLLISILISLSSGFAQTKLFKPFSLNTSEERAYPSAIYYSNFLQQQTNSNEKSAAKVAPIVYIHLFGGMGFSILSSSKIESLLDDDFGIGIGLPTWSWGFISGYKNIAQIEYNNGIADHDFNNNSIRPDIPSKVIKMDYETTDLQFKVNPLFWNMEENIAYFIIIGKGDVEWRDKNNDGFSGSSQIYGLEYAQFTKYLSWSVSFKRYGISFKETILFNVPFNIKTKASDYILELKVGFGFGV